MARRPLDDRPLKEGKGGGGGEEGGRVRVKIAQAIRGILKKSQHLIMATSYKRAPLLRLPAVINKYPKYLAVNINE